jgi:hypothetical protein
MAAEIVNLRRVRKSKARDANAKQAETNRVQHGAAKPARALAKARRDIDAKKIDAHRLEDEEK